MFLTLASLMLAQAAPQGRPTEPYSLPPVASSSRGGQALTRLVPDGTPGPVPFPVTAADAAPLPVPAPVGFTPQGDTVDGAAMGDPHFLGFVGEELFPPQGQRIDPALLAQSQPAYADGRPAAETYAFVMFAKRMTEERLERLEEAGARLLGFHPHHTQKVALSRGAIEVIASLDFVRWIGVSTPTQRVHPRLAEQLQGADPTQAIEVWVNVYESDVSSTSVARTMPGRMNADRQGRTTRDASEVTLANVWRRTNGWQEFELLTSGLDVLHFDGRINAFRARMLPGQLGTLQSFDFVQFIEWAPPARLMHEESMPMVNADDVRVFHNGGTNQVAIAGIVDSGVEVDHQDLSMLSQGYDLSGSATGTPFDDDCGHGTHVAGTILGQGNVDPAQTGVAPGLGWGSMGRFLILRIFSTCAGQPVDESAVLALQTTVQGTTPVPHVVNNSWGTEGQPSAPWVGTEAGARLYDNAAYTNAQLNVFAAGNDGSSSSSIGLQPSAKNVLTVGSVNSYDSVEGAASVVSGFSSRGPCADGRWKPNLMAPGQVVTSLDAFDTTGYTQSFGTSMAAPHVTGIVADLIDKDASYAYLPERISAQLMATANRASNLPLSLASDPILDTYGAGRVDATEALWNGAGGTSASWAFSLNPSEGMTSNFTVPTGATRLVAVMHYVEPSASAGAAKALVNDWDLILDQPPLQPGAGMGDWYAHVSRVDNTEIRVLDNPIAGTWDWEVTPISGSTLAYFGLTIYVQTLDTDPAINPTFTATDHAVQPFTDVTFDYSLATPGAGISAVNVDVFSDIEAVVTAASTQLIGGQWTDLMDNPWGGLSVELGNVSPFFQRSAQWKVHWPTEGAKLFKATTWQETNLSYPSQTESITVDGTPPGLVNNLMSPTHTPSVWSSDDSLDVTWTFAFDPVSGGVSSGVTSYAHVLSPSSPGTPGTVPNDFDTSATFSGLTTGSHWFSIRAFDAASNYGGVKDFGPIQIDLVAPAKPNNFVSTTHTPSVSSCNQTITMTWDPVVDAHSGILGYGVGIDSTPPTTANTFTNSFTATLSPGSHSLTVRSIDNAGNVSGTKHSEVFVIDPNPVGTYCAAKVNSQGCLPTIGSTGSPSLSGAGITVTATNVLNNKVGLLFWGTGSSSNPFQGGTKCVANPTKRTGIQDSAGNPPPDDCSGTYAFTFDPAFMGSKGIAAGDTIYTQFWSRDPSAPFNTGLTDGLWFTACQ